jgi:hypothetical protein
MQAPNLRFVLEEDATWYKHEWESFATGEEAMDTHQVLALADDCVRDGI